MRNVRKKFVWIGTMYTREPYNNDCFKPTHELYTRYTHKKAVCVHGSSRRELREGLARRSGVRVFTSTPASHKRHHSQVRRLLSMMNTTNYAYYVCMVARLVCCYMRISSGTMKMRVSRSVWRWPWPQQTRWVYAAVMVWPKYRFFRFDADR